MAEKEKKEVFTEEKAMKLIQKERTSREDLCAKELQSLLEKHRCRLDPEVSLSAGNSPRFSLKVVAV